ncbi:actin-binding Rho-activating protein [Osmerus mordax]|uniref:actin-binding Rho-activating protein n=1 Tax=Osmerus mordax TaxID=8014 RepID=UPI00350FC129
MSGIAAPQDPKPEARPFVRAVRKIKCAAMVHSLARSWQGWATEHSDRQETIPSGWMPSSVTEGEEGSETNSKVKLTVKPRMVATNEDGGSQIRTSAVTKRAATKPSEGGGNLISALKERIMAPEDPGAKDFLGGGSPTRRRQVRALALQSQNQDQDQDRKLGSRSSSVDTEDSGLGDEALLAGNSSDSRPALLKKQPSRPKIKVTNMNDIKSRWQQWSQQHVEGQKLNPFSEDFDYEHAMSQRLQKGDAGYGKPKEGTRTAERGDRAQKHVQREMEEMCFIIRDMGLTDKQGRVYITFGRLFDRYVKISDKVVGIALRCRKHKMLDFEGEMLWKGQDDHVIITLKD